MCKACLEMTGCAWRRVQAGESLQSIARALGVAPLRLLELNPYMDPAELVEGLPLLVPEPAAHVRYAETLEALGQRLGMEEERLLGRNPLCRVPLPGQRVWR